MQENFVNILNWFYLGLGIYGDSNDEDSSDSEADKKDELNEDRDSDLELLVRWIIAIPIYYSKSNPFFFFFQ